MIKEIPEIKPLLENGEYEEAYQYLTNMLEQKPNDVNILYTRGIIDSVHIKKYISQTIIDFEYVVKKVKKLEPILYPFLTILCDINDDLDKVIIYGEKCKFDDDENPMKIDVYWALSRAYYSKSSFEGYLKAKEYIDLCIELSEEDIEDFYYYKCEILLALKQINDLEELLNTCYIKFGGEYNYYFLNANLYFLKAKKDPQDIYFDEAINNADTAASYNPDEEYRIITFKVDVYCLQKKYDIALTLVEKLIKWFPEDDVLIEKLKIYEEMNDLESVKKISRDFLLHNDSWKIKYSLGYALGTNPLTEEELKEAKVLLEESYYTSDKLFIISDLFRVNKQLRLDEDNLKIITQLLEIYPDNGGLFAMLGETIQRLNYPYDQIIYNYEQAYKLGWISEFEYLDDLLPLLENPSKLNKKFKKYQTIDKRLLSGWMKRRIGIKYLYGENNYPKDMQKAYEYLLDSLNEFPNVSCYHSTMGRFYEFNKNKEKAFEHYDRGYFIYFNEIKPFCNCSAGYIAHAYLNGIGVEKNKERAKLIILDSIKEAENYSCSTVIYLYCYFYLIGEKEFDGSLAKKYLELSYPFDRNEITRLIYLKQINDSLNIDNKQVLKEIKKIKKNLNKESKKYLSESLKEKVSYLFFGNY